MHYNIKKTKKSKICTNYEKNINKVIFGTIDVETTGLKAIKESIIEIGCVLFFGKKILHEESILSLSKSKVSSFIEDLTDINSEMIKDKSDSSNFVSKVKKIYIYMEHLLAYNAIFDKSFLDIELSRVNINSFIKYWVDPYIFVQELYRHLKNKKLVNIVHVFNIIHKNAHRALDDARATGLVYFNILREQKIQYILLSCLINKQNHFIRKKKYKLFIRKKTKRA